jgi:hypothetical protein
MKSILTVAALIAAGVPLVRAATTITPAASVNGLETYSVATDYQPNTISLYVLKPASYNPANRYKVLYILPAWELSHDGIDEAKRLNLADIYNIILVGPDFNGLPYTANWLPSPYYADWDDTSAHMRYGSYIPDIVVPFIDSHYATDTTIQGRIMVGFSKSGQGAFTQLLRYPAIFGRAGSWDGEIDGGWRPASMGITQAEFDSNYRIWNLLDKFQAIYANKPARFAIDSGGNIGGSITISDKMTQLNIPHYFGMNIGAHAWNSGWMGPLVAVLMSDDMTNPTAIQGPGPGNPIPISSLTASPNPFNQITAISFPGPGSRATSLCIYNTAGALVKRLALRGAGSAAWDGTGAFGKPVPRGLYYAVLSGPGVCLKTKLVYLRA